MKSLTALLCNCSSNKSNRPVNQRSLWCLIGIALAATLLIATPAFADCLGADPCTVIIGNTQYVVLPPCNYSTLGTPIGSCIIVSTSPAGPQLCVGGAIPCPSPNSIVQDPAAQPVTQSFEQNARQHVAALRGVPDDTLNAFWSRGEIRAYMYLHLLELANKPDGTLSAEDQAVVNYYTAAINAERLAVSTEALGLYNSWVGNPCAFKVPVGDPNAYLNQQATQFACSPGSAQECAIVNCIVPPISADQFNAWAAGFVLKNEINSWGQLLVAGPYIGLTLPQAQDAAGLEYDNSFGEISEGVGFLTADHAQIANVSSSSQITAQSDLQEQWLEGLHDFAGERLIETMQNAIASTASSELSGNEATLAQIFGVETAFSAVEDAAEESVLGTASASWDTFIGPIITAVAVIGVESWEIANAEGVQPQLQTAVCAVTTTATGACPGATAETLQQYAADPNGRQLILDALIKSTMPDYIVARLADPTYGSAPSPGPVVPADPSFVQNSNPPTPSFTSTDWSGNVDVTSVANGWFVTSASTSSGQTPLRYSSNVTYLTPNSINSTAGGVITITPVNVEQWRAWLNGNNFLALRSGIRAGFGHVEDAVNACPTVVVGGGGGVAPTAIDLGNICVKVDSEPFPVQKGDEIVIGGQVRTAAGNEFFNQADGNYYIQTTEAFENPSPPDGPITVLVQPDGNCLTSSVLGTRVSTPDCTSGSSITTDRGIVNIVQPTPTATFDLSTLGNITVGGPAFNVASFFHSNSSGVVTFSLAPRSVGCNVTPNGTVTITGAAVSPASCILIAAQAAAGPYAAAAALASSFHILPSTPTVSVTGGTFVFNGNKEPATGFAYGAGGLSDVQTPAVTFSYVGTNSTNYPATPTAPTNAGTYQVTASFAGNTNYGAASNVAAITISQAKPTVTFTGAPPSAARGTTFTISAKTNSTAIANITAAGSCSISTNTVTMTSNSGTCLLTAVWPADTNYLTASATQSTITPSVQVTNLIATVNSFNLSPKGATVSFTAELQRVAAELQRGVKPLACLNLDIFVLHVKAQTRKQLTAAQAQQLLTGASQIGVTVGCPFFR